MTAILASLVEGVCPRCAEGRIDDRRSRGSSRAITCHCLHICSNCRHHENLVGVGSLLDWPIADVAEEVYEAFQEGKIVVFYLDAMRRLVSPAGKFEVGYNEDAGGWPEYVDVD